MAKSTRVRTEVPPTTSMRDNHHLQVEWLDRVSHPCLSSIHNLAGSSCAPDLFHPIPSLLPVSCSSGDGPSAIPVLRPSQLALHVAHAATPRRPRSCLDRHATCPGHTSQACFAHAAALRLALAPASRTPTATSRRQCCRCRDKQAGSARRRQGAGDRGERNHGTESSAIATS